MLKIIHERSLKQQERLQIAKSYAQRLAKHCGQITAIVYGSTVRGDFKDYSDIDILIVSDALPSDPMQRLDFLYEFSKGLVEPKGYTTKEFKQILQSPFAEILQKEGLVIKSSDDASEIMTVDFADCF